MLTVRDQSDAAKLRHFLSVNLYEDTKAYVRDCGGVGSLPAHDYVLGNHSWALKAFIHNTLRQYLTNPHISAVFFPLLRYQGTPVRIQTGESLESPMLHLLVLCRFDQYEYPQPSFLPTNYLTSISSVAVGNDGDLKWEPQRGEARAPAGTPSSANWLQQVAPTFLNGT